MAYTKNSKECSKSNYNEQKAPAITKSFDLLCHVSSQESTTFLLLTVTAKQRQWWPSWFGVNQETTRGKIERRIWRKEQNKVERRENLRENSEFFLDFR